jgi:MFS family permease
MLIHQLWVVWLGLGVIGGIGLGLGYISPVSTLIKWFPDRRGMATGMAIMGFGGGAMIGSPLAVILMTGGNFINVDLPSMGHYQVHFDGFRTATSVGVWQTFMVIGAIYIAAMTAGAFGYRVPPEGWQPDGWTPPSSSHALITTGNVHLEDAHKTPQFWLIWIVLCMNVSAGIGVLAMASPMLQEIFAGSLIGLPDLKFGQLSEAQRISIAAIAGGFVGLLSLFNAGGRFFWASLSDYIGRKRTYFIFFALGIALYGSAPTLAHLGALALFVAAFCIILTMYGGGFATVPAYLADIFGTKYVGAIHGRLLTAWSTAGVLGPLAIGYIRDAQIAAGIPKAKVYDQTMYVLVGFLVIGLIANALIRPVHSKRLMKVDAEDLHGTARPVSSGSHGIGFGGMSFGALIAWLLVGIPFFWGVWNTIVKAIALFGGG